ncbi:MAG: hypothetical protein KKF33_03475 [Alphaproteobacteria bacterium]|nr:hypothetical protein [Alphaproteobacteria bacterium]
MAKAVKTTTIDLWAQINGGQQLNAEEQAVVDSGLVQAGKLYSPPEVLVLGQTHRDEVFRFCGIKPKKVIWHQRSRDQFPGAENWPYAQVDDLYLFFDPAGCWHGLNWDPGTEPSSLVRWVALREHEPREDDDVVAGRLRLLLNGSGARFYVALPNFIGALSRQGLSFELKGMGYDKWLSLDASAKTGTIAASFNLQTFKAKYESRFEIDYFLTSMAILSHAFWAAAAGSGTTE